VNIVSSVAYDGQKNASSSSYGTMSGTSMAAPYCAAAHILFKLVRPGYTGVEAANCMMASDVTTDLGTPRLRLEQALIACPARQ
jgi:Subtilase family